jgi:hypothetical protein
MTPHPKLALRALELARCGVRVVHRDRRESFEPLGVPRGQIRVCVVHQARDLSLQLARCEVDVGVEGRQDLEVDTDAVHVLDAARRIGHRRCDAEEPRNRMMCARWVSAERECTADLPDGRRVV